MKRWMRALVGTIMAVMCLLPVAAFAAEVPQVSIPVTVSLSGTLPTPAEAFGVKLEADDKSFPMPEGAQDGVFTMAITGADTMQFPAISYAELGVYTYTVSQIAGSNKKCTYDDTVYSLTVYITNAEDGSGLEATAVLHPDQEGEKLSGALFQNVYETEKPVEPEAPKTGDNATPVFYLALMTVSFGAMVCLWVVGKTRKVEE